MLRRGFNGIALVSAVLLVLAAGLAAFASHLDPRKHHLSLSNAFHIGLIHAFSGQWTGSIVFFNDPDYGPYTGSIIDVGPDGRPAASQVLWHVGDYGAVRRTRFDSQGEWKHKMTAWNSPGVYYRHFVFRGRGVLWTVMVSLGHVMIFFGVLPALWAVLRLRDRWRRGPNSKGVRSPIH